MVANPAIKLVVAKDLPLEPATSEDEADPSNAFKSASR
jgi:hypothetical protein